MRRILLCGLVGLIVALAVVSCDTGTRGARAKIGEPVVADVAAGDGDYYAIELPCKCGGILAYYPDSCPCFNATDYPELHAALVDVYDWLLQNKPAPTRKLTGKFETILLTCGCSLTVYIPKSSTCLEKKYPDLAGKLALVYSLAQKHRDPSGDPPPPPKRQENGYPVIGQASKSETSDQR